ncbi:T9SS type A sorting domain-containing protein, partial [bacterium]|nr:T9SS type A sorting domain-containing protein [bacterium]
CYDQYNANIQFFDYTNSPLPEFNINDLLMDRRDTLWVGTETGLFCYNGVGWTQFTTENSGLCDNRVRCLSVTSDNTLWIGTYNGVSRYTGEVLITSVDENATKPETLPVIRSFPNPFNPSTTIEFSLPEAGAASLDIYNIAGQKVRGLVTEILTAGRHTAVWDGKDNSGATVSAGIFFARLTCGERTTTGKMVMVK